MYSALCLVTRVYIYILFGRVIISFLFMFRPDWAPPEGVRPLFGVIYSLTDPPVNFLRRFIPPLSMGMMALDLAFLAWFFIAQFLHRFICSLGI